MRGSSFLWAVLLAGFSYTKRVFRLFFAQFQNTVLYKIGSTIIKCKNEIKIRLIFLLRAAGKNQDSLMGIFFATFLKYILRKVF